MATPEHNGERSSPAAVIAIYCIAAVTIAAFGYGIGGPQALWAGVTYAFAGLLLGYISVGFAPRFIIVVALATGMLGSILRASTVPEFASLIPKQSTINYLRVILTICAAIGFGGGLYGGFRFTGQGVFNWVSRFLIARSQPLSITNASAPTQLFHALARHFYQSERMYFSVLTAIASAAIAQFEVAPLPRSLVIIVIAVLVATNLSWWFGEWLRPRLRTLGDMFRILRQMWEALAAFLVGYLIIIFIFACFYAAAWQFDRATAFRGIDATRFTNFADFVYFSIVTMSTVGYGDVIPANTLTRAIACIEVILGVGWVTVVLGVAAALARPKVDQMLRREWAASGEGDPEATTSTNEPTPSRGAGTPARS